MDTDLTTGSPPGWPNGWSIAAALFNFESLEYEAMPLAWVEQEPATKADVDAIDDAFPDYVEKLGLDIPSMKGKADPRYSTKAERLKRKFPGRYAPVVKLS